MIFSPDHSDKKILSLLQQDARSSLYVLAEETGLSVPSVQRRLKKLREENIIEKEIAVLNPAALNQSMSFIIMVEMERERLDQLENFHRVIKKESQVQQCYYVTGEADFCLVCLARDMADFEALTQRLFFDNKNVRRFRTSVVMGRPKVTLNVPIEYGI